MAQSQWYEIIGYAASLLILVSLIMRSVLRLRVINLVGSIVFAVYGLLIQSYPVAAVNFIIALVNLYYLYEMFSMREYFRLLQVQPDSDYLKYFLRFNLKDIQKHLPEFEFEPEKDQVIFFILRNVVPAGLVIGKPLGEDGLLLVLDFVIPGYRDSKIGDFIFRLRSDFFEERGFNRICSKPGSKDHSAYLRRMGFKPGSGDYAAYYVLELS